MGLTFSNSSDPCHLVAPERRQVLGGVVVRIVEGKLRAKALFNTANYIAHKNDSISLTLYYPIVHCAIEYSVFPSIRDV